MARWYDHLLTLLPFEPPYFEAVGLAASHVGHPVVESGAERGDAARFRATQGIAADELVISVLPGSRGGEVRRLMPVFGAALRHLETLVGLAFSIPGQRIALLDALGRLPADWGHLRHDLQRRR